MSKMYFSTYSWPFFLTERSLFHSWLLKIFFSGWGIRGRQFFLSVPETHCLIALWYWHALFLMATWSHLFLSSFFFLQLLLTFCKLSFKWPHFDRPLFSHLFIFLFLMLRIHEFMVFINFRKCKDIVFPVSWVISGTWIVCVFGVLNMLHCSLVS